MTKFRGGSSDSEGVLGLPAGPSLLWAFRDSRGPKTGRSPQQEGNLRCDLSITCNASAREHNQVNIIYLSYLLPIYDWISGSLTKLSNELFNN